MADITLTAAPVTWQVANLIQGSKARGANGYVEFEASAVAVHHGGLMWLPSPQRAEMADGVLAPIDLPINDAEVWNWRVTPHLGVTWEPFHINVEEGGTNLASAAIVPGKGPVKVVQGPAGASVVDFRDTGDGALVLVLSDGTESPPIPFTRGPQGPANEIEIGTVLRGDEAYASLSGDAPHQVLNLVLPKGDPGDPNELVDATTEQRGLMSAEAVQTLAATEAVAATAERGRPSRATVDWGETGGVPYSVVRVFDAVRPGVIAKSLGDGFEDQGATDTGLVPPRETLRGFTARTGYAVAANADGWTVDGNVGEMRGPQIVNGQILHDFRDPAEGSQGVEALGIRADGTYAGYSALDGDTAQSMVDDGVVTSFSFGPRCVAGGMIRDISDPLWSSFHTTLAARQIVGFTADGTLLIITVTGVSGASGIAGTDCGPLALSLGAHDAWIMDGGGSAQTAMNAEYAMPSSDAGCERPVPSALLVNATVATGAVKSPWFPIKIQGPVQVFDRDPKYRINGSHFEFSGGVQTNDGTKIPTSIPYALRIPFQPAVQTTTPAPSTGLIQGKLVCRYDGQINLYGDGQTVTYLLLDPLRVPYLA